MKKLKYSLILLHIVLMGACILCFPIFRKSQMLQSFSGPEDKVFAATGLWNAELGEYYVDDLTGEAGVFTCGPYLELPRGIYEVSVYYRSTGKGNVCYIHDDDAHTFARALYTDVVELDANHTMKQFTIWVNKPLHYVELRSEFAGEGSLAIKQIVIRQTTQSYLRNVFDVLLLLVAIDLFVLLWWAVKQQKISKKSVMTGILLTGMILFASAPFLKEGILSVEDRQTIGDNNIHLMRIVGLAKGMKNGEFPVWVHPEWLNGYGYAIPLFYGDLFLYLPALLLLIGFPLFWVYNCYLLFMNAVTCLIAYFCYKAMFNSRRIGLFTSLLSVWSVYHMTVQVNYESLGVFTSYAFLPLVAYGVYLAYDKPREQRTWIILALGMTGLLNSHLLTSEITVLAIALTILLTGKAFWRKERILAMCKAVVGSILLNLGFLIPFLSYMRKDLVINSATWTEEPWQNRGPSIAEHFALFSGGGTERKTDFVLLVGVFLLILVIVECGYRSKKDQERYGKIAVLTAILCVGFTWLSTSYFPWDFIYVHFPWTHWLTASIQEPMRFAQLAQVFGVVSAGCTAKILLDRKEQWFRYYLIGMCAAAFLSFGYLISDYLEQGVLWKVYDVAGLDTTNIATMEYLPAGADPDLFVQEFATVPENVLLLDYVKKGTDISFVGQNLNDAEVSVELPLVYYWNYVAKDGNGQQLRVECSDRKTLEVVLPAGYEGMVSVYFRAPFVWYLAKVISALALLGIGLLVIKNTYEGRYESI